MKERQECTRKEEQKINTRKSRAWCKEQSIDNKEKKNEETKEGKKVCTDEKVSGKINFSKTIILKYKNL